VVSIFPQGKQRKSNDAAAKELQRRLMDAAIENRLGNQSSPLPSVSGLLNGDVGPKLRHYGFDLSAVRGIWLEPI
jgi:hypothetical protein